MGIDNSGSNISFLAFYSEKRFFQEMSQLETGLKGRKEKRPALLSGPISVKEDGD
jgi:hypothetical protein